MFAQVFLFNGFSVMFGFDATIPLNNFLLMETIKVNLTLKIKTTLFLNDLKHIFSFSLLQFLVNYQIILIYKQILVDNICLLVYCLGSSSLDALGVDFWTHSLNWLDCVKKEWMRITEIKQRVKFPPPSGLVSLNDWACAVESVMHLGLPWRMLRSQLATSKSSDSMIDYHEWFNELAIKGANTDVRMLCTVYHFI